MLRSEGHFGFSAESGRLKAEVIGLWPVRARCLLQHCTEPVYFENGYESECLAHILESVMQHQDAFTLPQDLGRPGLLQIPRPREEESAAAAASVKEICEYFCSGLAQVALA